MNKPPDRMIEVDHSLAAEPEPTPKKLNRHVTIALRHLNVQREKLLTKRADLTKQIDEIDKAILALE